MKSTVKFISRDGCEAITINQYDKFTIENFIQGDDAKYGTTYHGAFIEEISGDGNTLTIKFRADYTETELKSTK